MTWVECVLPPLLLLLQLLCQWAAAGAASASPPPRASPPTAKHLILLVVDDLGFGDLGFTGSAVKTPVLDELATTGVILSNYYVMRACSPRSRPGASSSAMA